MGQPRTQMGLPAKLTRPQKLWQGGQKGRERGKVAVGRDIYGSHQLGPDPQLGDWGRTH